MQIEESGFEFLSIAREVAKRSRFFHWDLEFAEVFDQGGFDLVIGNPPWAAVRWEEEGFFEEISPGTSAIVADSKVKHALYADILKSSPQYLPHYKVEAARVGGLINFLKSSGTFPFEDSSITNTYKYFYQRFRQTAAENKVHAMIAQDGILTDDGCVSMRPGFLSELVRMYRFINEKKLFEDVGNSIPYMVWLCKKRKAEIGFDLIDNLYHPVTVTLCRNESPLAGYPGQKTGTGGFNLAGHPKRIVRVDESVLADLSKFSPGVDAASADVPLMHGQWALEILRVLGKHETKMNFDRIQHAESWHESDSPIDGFIKRHPGCPEDIADAVLTGPNIFVGNPAIKTVNSTAKNQRDFSAVDLVMAPDNYFPDTVYRLTEKGKRSETYRKKAPWATQMSSQYRLMGRGMVAMNVARVLSAAIIPPGPTHVHSCFSLCFQDLDNLVDTSGLFNSILFEFLMRSFSGGTISQSVLKMIPAMTPNQRTHALIPALRVRALRLSAISEYYSDLWTNCYDVRFLDFEVMSNFQPALKYSGLSAEWTRETCVRDWKAREQALCEIDAIVAIIFGFDKQALLNLYRSQFGVLQSNLYDLPGEVVPEGKEGSHFPRFEAMSKAFDAAIEFLKKSKFRKAS